MYSVAIALASLLIAQTLSGQQVQKGSWAEVVALWSGAKVKVARFAAKEARGQFVSAGEDAINIRDGRDEIRVERSDVRQVQIRSVSGRARNAAIGAAVGGGLGLGLGGILLAATGGSDSTNELLAGFTFIGAATGFGVGWIPPGYSTVYRAKR